jgi:hypothetical protein
MPEMKHFRLILFFFLLYQIIGYFLTFYFAPLIGMNNIQGEDFGIYYKEIYNFYNGNYVFNDGFFYLSYFFILYSWVILFPIQISILIHIGIRLILLIWILKSLKTRIELDWFYANTFFFILFSSTFNINILIIFSFLFYQKYHDKWFAPFILLLGFYKLTVILPFSLLFLINWYYEKKIHWKTIPAFVIVGIIGGISFLINRNLIINNIANHESFNVVIQIPHFIWLSYPICVFMGYVNINEKGSLRFWKNYFIFTVGIFLIWLVFSIFPELLLEFIYRALSYWSI